MNNQQMGDGGAFRLIDLKNGLYQLHTRRHGAIEGPIKAVCAHAVRSEMEWKELEDAIVALGTTSDNVAEFGIAGTFMYTTKRTLA